MQKSCIVVPCYNEAKRLRLDLFSDFILSNPHIDIMFCNDGSSDGTLNLLQTFFQKHPDRVYIHNLTENSGKAQAVRVAIISSFQTNRYFYIGYWDADLATPLDEINHLLFHLTSGNKHLVMGSRMKRLGSNVNRKGLRHFFGRVFSTFASLILKLPVYDSQCGAKIFNAHEVAPLFNEKFISNWLFDVELLARYRNRHSISATLLNVAEIPINSWTEQEGSKLKLKDFIKVPLELLRIHSKYNK